MLAVTAQVIQKSLNGNDGLDLVVVVEAVDGADRKSDTLTVTIALDDSAVTVNRLDFEDRRSTSERSAGKAVKPSYLRHENIPGKGQGIEEMIATEALQWAAPFGRAPARVYVFGL